MELINAEKSEDYDVIVVGGGAAGTFAAITAARDGKNVLLVERNGEIGKKLRITGKGRCNVTNNCPPEEVVKNIPHNHRFMYSVSARITPQNVMEFFEELGVPLKVERGKRVFPVSDKASDIVAAIQRELERLNVSFLGKRATEILVKETAIGEKTVFRKCIGIRSWSDDFFAPKVIICTGGLSYPQTGSDGTGYELARKAGHEITMLAPSLVPIESCDSFCREMMGLTLKNVVLTVKSKANRRVFSEMGELIFTHFGISGPLTLSASAHMHELPIDKYTLHIDLKPALTLENLDNRLRADFEKNKNKKFQNSLSELLPLKMIPIMVRVSGIDPDKKVNSVTKEERFKLANLLKAFPVKATAFRSIKEAVVTRGGVSIKEIDPKTMESKLVKGLYFAGEIIDVDAYTGGFNLQIAFSTGYIAAISN